MDNRLNNEKIRIYSEQVSDVLMKSFFADKQKISGEEILNLCTIKQVNLFTLKVLFQEWKNESKKLESPYFDYENKEVLDAITGFKNILSRHILVEQSVFQPMLTQAIFDSLMLICSPYHYYLNELDNANQQRIQPAEMLNENKKFTKINNAILEGLIKNLEKVRPNTERQELEKTLDEVVGTLSSEPEDMESYILSFSNYVSLDINEFYLEVEQPVDHEPIEEIEKHEEIQENEPEATGISHDLYSEPLAESTLNEALAMENQTSLADMHEQQKIESLSKGITLNQRFMFVNVLFDGDVAKFNNTVMEIDGLETLGEAEKYLNVHYGQWNSEGQEVEEFRGILARRFS